MRYRVPAGRAREGGGPHGTIRRDASEVIATGEVVVHDETFIGTFAGFQSTRCGAWKLTESAPPVQGAQVTGYDEWLDGTKAFYESLSAVATDLDAKKKPKVIRRTAKPLAKELRAWLLSVTPDECYADDYVAMWVLFGTLQHMADGTAGNGGRFFPVPDLERHAAALASTDCP